MTVITNTKFDVDDVVYVADYYYDFYANRKPYIIQDILIDIDIRRTHIEYEVIQDDMEYRVPEAWTFATYEECAKWCEEHN